MGLVPDRTLRLVVVLAAGIAAANWLAVSAADDSLVRIFFPTLQNSAVDAIHAGLGAVGAVQLWLLQSGEVSVR